MSTPTSSPVEWLERLASQADDPKWLAIAREKPGIASMWLGNVRHALAQIYGKESIPVTAFPRINLPAEPAEGATAINRAVPALKRVLAVLREPSSQITTVRTELGGRKIFLGHGRSPEWLKVKDFLTTKLGFDCVEFNSDSVAGKTTFERLIEMLDQSCFAFLIMTAEDRGVDRSMHPRENVIHEAGLFQGRLGPRRAIIVLAEDCEEFTNIVGLTQIRFPPGRISAAFWEMAEVLEREGIVSKHAAPSAVASETAELNSEARNLLAAASAGDGTITIIEALNGTYVDVSGTSYGGLGNARALAKWRAGLDQLVESKLVRDLNGTGETFNVTDEGYRTADGF